MCCALKKIIQPKREHVTMPKRNNNWFYILFFQILAVYFVLIRILHFVFLLSFKNGRINIEEDTRSSNYYWMRWTFLGYLIQLNMFLIWRMIALKRGTNKCTHTKKENPTKWSKFCDELRKGCSTSDSNSIWSFVIRNLTYFICKWIASKAANKQDQFFFLGFGFCH